MRSTKDVYVICCEGPTEYNLFGFFKTYFCSKPLSFKYEIMGGFNDLKTFSNKVSSLTRKYEIKPKKLSEKIHFFFMADYDLDDSQKIALYIKGLRHKVQLCNPNPEGVLLEIVGKKIKNTIDSKNFRSICKKNFLSHFGKEAQHMKNIDLIKIIPNNIIFKTYFPEIHKLFNS